MSCLELQSLHKFLASIVQTSLYYFQLIKTFIIFAGNKVKEDDLLIEYNLTHNEQIN